IFDGTRNTNTNSFTLSGFQQGITTINADGIRVEHSDMPGQYSEIRADGFIRKWQYGEAKYLNDVYAEIYTIPTMPHGAKPNNVTIYLPQSFRGRGNEIQILLSQIGSEMAIGRIDSSGNVINLTFRTKTVLNIVDYSLNTTNPYVTVEGYMEQTFRAVGSNIETDYAGLTFMIMVLGK
ncbi:MAG: hypothetical protein GXZ11_08245, partial [Tissierellia bacterium]|nr:hypothetical protein [Tissierellia bacterium]